jgi:DNA polymerase-1
MRLVADIESDGLLDTITKVHCNVSIDRDTKEVHKFRPNEIRDGLSLMEQADEIAFHNGIGFDLPALRKLYPDFNPKAKIIDTLVFSRLAYLNLADIDLQMIRRGKLDKDTFVVNRKGKAESAIGSHSLEAWGHRLGVAKGDYGKQEDAWSMFSEEMLKYCEQDDWVLLKLLEKLETKGVPQDALDLELKVAEILFRQEQRGWKIDLEKAQVLYAKLCQRREELTKELQEIFPGWYSDTKTPEYYEIAYHRETYRHESKAKLEDIVYYEAKHQGDKVTRADIKSMITTGPLKRKYTPFNPGSGQHVYRAFKEKYGWVPKDFTPTGEVKVNEKVLLGLPYTEAKVLLEREIVNDRLEKLAEGKNGGYLTMERNGRLHCYMNGLGCVTSRCSHSNPNLGQVPSMKATLEYPKGKPYSREFRELFIVDKGFKLLGTDAEGQELRCLGHYLYPYDGGVFAIAVANGNKEEGTDVHTLNMKAAGLLTRDQAKTFIYAYLYGAGDAKIGSIVLPNGTEAEQKKAGKKLKKQFLDSMPALKKLRQAIVDEAEKYGYIVTLDGRKIPIRSSHAALNSLLQSTGAILSKRWMLFVDEEVKARGLQDFMWQVSFVHDELNWEVKEGYEGELKAICKEAMKKTEKYYDFRCPLDAGVAIGNNWYEVH